MKNKYKEYLKERQNCEFLEEDYGFATYTIDKDICYLQDVYVIPEERKKGYSHKLANEVSKLAKNKDCKIIITTINKEQNNEDESNLKTIEKYGFIMINEDIKAKYFIKEL